MIDIDLQSIKKVHFVGIKGVAMAALAIWAKERGWKVSGSDVEEKFPTDERLKANGIRWNTGFNSKNVPSDADLVIVTGAHGGKTNIEAQEAQKRNIPTIMQGQALGLISFGKQVIAVAGSHGKTTTSAILAHILSKAGKDPSYIVGCGSIKSLGNPAHCGKGAHFVLEADEYINCPNSDKTPKFFFLNQSICIITNIEFDHPDAYSSREHVEESFLAFANKTRPDGWIIAGQDNPGVKKIIPKIVGAIETYGKRMSVTYHLNSLTFSIGKTEFSLSTLGKSIGPFMLQIPGEHNALNAVAASIAAHHVGISWKEIITAISSFAGTKRRFELIGKKDVFFYDDYAHHPTEILATLKAARLWYRQKRIIAIFQPHTFSRTKALFNEFSRSFGYADIVILSDIYASARESRDETISSSQLADRMKSIQPGVVYRPDKKNVVDYLVEIARPGDVIITMGAGDIYSWIPDIKGALKL